MGFTWNYNSKQYNESQTGKSNLLPEGDYRAEIDLVSETMANNGRKGLEIELYVNGYANKLRHYIWYNPENPARTNQLIGEFFNSFDIREDEQDASVYWYNKRGAVRVVHAEYKGRTIAKVEFCLSRNQQKALPEWPDETSKHNEETCARETIQTSKATPCAPRTFSGLSF
jgi:hypothetical protein